MFCLSGTGSMLECDIFPPLKLSKGVWEIGLVNFTTYNSIPNIEMGSNNTFNYGTTIISIPTGAYEIDAINKLAKEQARVSDGKKDGEKDNLEIRANLNTLKVEIWSREKIITFPATGSIAPVLGFKTGVTLTPNEWHSSTEVVAINKINVIRIECNVVRGSYDNGRESHVIHEFYPTVPPGFKIVEIPRNVIYLPVSTTQLDKICISLKDQRGEPINLMGEIVNVRLHLRRV